MTQNCNELQMVPTYVNMMNIIIVMIWICVLHQLIEKIADLWKV